MFIYNITKSFETINSYGTRIYSELNQTVRGNTVYIRNDS